MRIPKDFTIIPFFVIGTMVVGVVGSIFALIMLGQPCVETKRSMCRSSTCVVWTVEEGCTLEVEDTPHPCDICIKRKAPWD